MTLQRKGMLVAALSSMLLDTSYTATGRHYDVPKRKLGSKYQPHQGKKECARRVATGCGGWYTPIKPKENT